MSKDWTDPRSLYMSGGKIHKAPSYTRPTFYDGWANDAMDYAESLRNKVGEAIMCAQSVGIDGVGVIEYMLDNQQETIIFNNDAICKVWFHLGVAHVHDTIVPELRPVTTITDSFCKHCGASIPHRMGEGRCDKCMDHLPPEAA